MAIFQALLFLIGGSDILLVDYQSRSRGWLPCGPEGFKGRRECRRAKQPVLYWVMFGVYAAADLSRRDF